MNAVFLVTLPPAVVSVTVTLPAVWAGVVAVTDDVPIDGNVVASTVPNSTVEVVARLLPWMVTTVPPVTVPDVGVSDVSVGGGTM